MKTNHRSLAFVFHKVHTLQALSNLAILSTALVVPAATMAQTSVLNPLEWRYVTSSPYPSPTSPYLIWDYTYPGNSSDTHADFTIFSPYAAGFFTSGIAVPLPAAPEWLMQSGFPFSYGAYGFSMRGASVSVTFTATSTDGLVCYSGPQDGNTGNIPVTSVPVTLTSSVTTGSPGTNIACWNTGKQGILITITRFAITYSPNLKAGDLQVSQSGATQDPQSSNLQVVPNVPVQVDVPISGFTGFDAPSGASTTVTLKAGSQTLPPQTVYLSEIPANGAKTVSFFVTFKPEDAGSQDIIATVDPENSLGESDLNDNTASAKVTVKPQYKLSLSLSQQQIYPDMSDISQSPGNTDSIVTAKLTTNSGSPVSGKTIQFSVTPKDGSGGHTHTDGRPVGHFKNDEDSCDTLDDGTCTVTYTASKFGGIETVSGELVDSPSVNDSQDLTVKVPGLSQLGGGTYLFKCAIENCAGYKHQNFYGVQPFVDEDMFAIGAMYSGNHPKDTPLVVTDASLPWGGLYDHKNTWARPHTFHRAGTDVDIRSTSIPDDNKDSFESTACTLGGVPVLEYPNQTNEHYHIYFNAYSAKLAKLCDSIL